MQRWAKTSSISSSSLAAVLPTMRANLSSRCKKNAHDRCGGKVNLKHGQVVECVCRCHKVSR